MDEFQMLNLITTLLYDLGLIGIIRGALIFFIAMAFLRYLTKG